MSIWKLGLDSKFSTLWNVSYAQVLGYPYDYCITLCYDVAKCKVSEHMVFLDYSWNRMSGFYDTHYWCGKRKSILVFYPSIKIPHLTVRDFFKAFSSLSYRYEVRYLTS